MNDLPDESALEAPDQETYARPFGWWGYHWTPPERHSLLWLIERSSLDVPTAAFLSLAIELRASIIIAAEPHEAGKTTLLTALIDFLPPETTPVYLRGWYERFAFLDQVEPARAYLLCNEISSHLPTYLWGRGVKRMFDAVAAGYPLATTMHASGANDALDQLTGYPLNVPARQLTRLDLVITIGVGYASNRLLRRVSRIERIGMDDEGPFIEKIAVREPLRGDLEYQIGHYVGSIAEIGAISDPEASRLLARRTRLLEGWLAAGYASEPSLRDRVIAARGAEPS